MRNCISIENVHGFSIYFLRSEMEEDEERWPNIRTAKWNVEFLLPHCRKMTSAKFYLPFVARRSFSPNSSTIRHFKIHVTRTMKKTSESFSQAQRFPQYATEDCYHTEETSSVRLNGR